MLELWNSMARLFSVLYLLLVSDIYADTLTLSSVSLNDYVSNFTCLSCNLFGSALHQSLSMTCLLSTIFASTIYGNCYSCHWNSTVIWFHRQTIKALDVIMPILQFHVPKSELSQQSSEKYLFAWCHFGHLKKRT